MCVESTDRKKRGQNEKKRHLEKNFHLQSSRGEGEKVERGKGCKGEGGKVYSSPASGALFALIICVITT